MDIFAESNLGLVPRYRDNEYGRIEAKPDVLQIGHAVLLWGQLETGVSTIRLRWMRPTYRAGGPSLAGAEGTIEDKVILGCIGTPAHTAGGDLGVHADSNPAPGAGYQCLRKVPAE